MYNWTAKRDLETRQDQLPITPRRSDLEREHGLTTPSIPNPRDRCESALGVAEVVLVVLHVEDPIDQATRCVMQSIIMLDDLIRSPADIACVALNISTRR
jgi:hypothetical protein